MSAWRLRPSYSTLLGVHGSRVEKLPVGDRRLGVATAAGYVHLLPGYREGAARASGTRSST